MEEGDFAVLESTKHTLLINNEVCKKARFHVDQQGLQVYMKMELKVVGLQHQRFSFLGRKDCRPAQPATKVKILREQVLPTCLKTMIVYHRVAQPDMLSETFMLCP